MSFKILTAIIAVVFAFINADAQITRTTNNRHHFGYGINGGLIVGDYENLYSSNVGLDLYYLYGVSQKFYLGGTTGFAYYFGENINVPDMGKVQFDDAQFIPIALSLRFTPFKRFAMGADVGYGIGLNDTNDGGFYASPRATYFIADKFPAFVGYRLIDFRGASLGSIQIGFGYKF